MLEYLLDSRRLSILCPVTLGAVAITALAVSGAGETAATVTAIAVVLLSFIIVGWRSIAQAEQEFGDDPKPTASHDQ